MLSKLKELIVKRERGDNDDIWDLVNTIMNMYYISDPDSNLHEELIGQIMYDEICDYFGL